MYYYIVVDKIGKILEIFPAESCEAATEKAYAKTRLNIELSGIQSIQFCNRYKFIFNGESNKINLNSVYKYARKYKIIGGATV